ncbi:MAG: Hpt domain-containing protein [Proteobacteria bacterium]|nr:Hpt domain-containing protein [Pseudomonadota bacterium]
MTQPAVDEATFKALEQTTGAEFVKELVGTFLAEAPGMIASLRAARDAHDIERFRRTAHSLKSNANTFGATLLAARARALELGAADAVHAPDTHAITELQHAFEHAAARLTELTNA